MVLEWSSDHAVEDAHDDPDVLAAWDRKAELAEYMASGTVRFGQTVRAWACDRRSVTQRTSARLMSVKSNVASTQFGSAVSQAPALPRPVHPERTWAA